MKKIFMSLFGLFMVLGLFACQNGNNSTISSTTSNNGLKTGILGNDNGEKLKKINVLDENKNVINGSIDLKPDLYVFSVVPTESMAKIGSITWEASYDKKIDLSGTYKGKEEFGYDATITITYKEIKIRGQGYGSGYIQDDGSVHMMYNDYLTFEVDENGDLIVDGAYDGNGRIHIGGKFTKEVSVDSVSKKADYSYKKTTGITIKEGAISLAGIETGYEVKVKVTAVDAYDENNKVESEFTINIIE